MNIQRLKADAMKDERYLAILNAKKSGFESFRNRYGTGTKFPEFSDIQDFRPHWANLSAEGNLVVWKSRIFLPEVPKPYTKGIE